MPHDPSPPTSHRYPSQRLSLNYVDWGNPGAPNMLLIHGGRDHARSWDWVAGAFADDYHVIAPDLRGHGDSEWTNTGPYGVDEFVFDIAELIHLKELAPLTIIGHSLGGILALRYTGLYPENVVKLIAIEGLGFGRGRSRSEPTDPVPKRYRDWLEKMRDLTQWEERRYENFDAALARMREANKHLSDAQVRHLTEHGAKRNDDGSYSWKFDHYFFSRFIAPAGLDPDEVRAVWANIACPTLLVRGGKSWTTDPEQDGNAAAFRDARCVTFDDAGHWVHHDDLDGFLTLAKEFLSP